MRKMLLLILMTLLLLSGCSSDNKKSDINPDYVEGSYAIFENSTELYSPYDVFKTIETLMSVQPITYNRKDLDEYYNKQASSIFFVYIQLMNMIVANNDNFINPDDYFKLLNIGMINYRNEMKNQIENQFNAFNEAKCYRDFILNDMSRVCGEFLGKTINLNNYDVAEIFTPDYFKVRPGVSYDTDKSNDFSPFKDKEQANTNKDEYLDNPNSAKPDEFEANDGDSNNESENESEEDFYEYQEGINYAMRDLTEEELFSPGNYGIINVDKAIIYDKPGRNNKGVGYWIDRDQVIFYDVKNINGVYWVKTDPNKEWWVCEDDLIPTGPEEYQ